MSILRYPGDVRDSLPRVLGGRFKVMGATYDEKVEQTLVEVLPLIDPLKAAGLA